MSYVKYDYKKYDKIAKIANAKYGPFKRFKVWINGKPYDFNDPDEVIILSRSLAWRYRNHNYDISKCIQVCQSMLHNSGHYENYIEAKNQLLRKCKEKYGNTITLKDIEDNFYIPLLVHRTIEGFKAEDEFIKWINSLKGYLAFESTEYMDRHMHVDAVVIHEGRVTMVQVKPLEWKEKEWYEHDNERNIAGMKEACKTYKAVKYGYAFYTRENGKYTFTVELCDYMGV